MLKDYHIHTKRCKHAQGEMHEYVEVAIEKNINEIAFTDHIPLPNDFDLPHRMAFNELEGYLNEVENLRRQYPELKIRSGIEADYYEGFEDFLDKTISEFQFDITIMSVHFIKNWPKNNWVFSYYFPDKSIEDIYSDYLGAVKKGVETGLFQIVGHLDLIKSEDAPLLSTNPEDLDMLLRSISKQKMAVELNTSGLRKAINELYPAPEIIPQLINYNIPITTGSDAHQPEQVGFQFNELEQQLKNFHNLQFAVF